MDGKLAGVIAEGDPIKDTTPAALQALKADGLRLVMLTGDSEATARAVATNLPIDGVIAEVQPKDKADVIARLQSQGRRVAIAGDGINDAPALAKADVGIAMGIGTDIEMESAQVTLVKSDLRGIVRARQLSRATVRNIRQNLFFAVGYNTLGARDSALDSFFAESRNGRLLRAHGAEMCTICSRASVQWCSFPRFALQRCQTTPSSAHRCQHPAFGRRRDPSRSPASQ